MGLEDGASIHMSERHPHCHQPQPMYDRQVRAFFNRVRERGALENAQPQVIYEDIQLYVVYEY